MWEKIKEFFSRIFESVGNFLKNMFGQEKPTQAAIPVAAADLTPAPKPRKGLVITEESILFLPEDKYRKVAELLYDEKRPPYVYSDSRVPGTLVKDRPKEEKKSEPKKPQRVIKESAWPFDMWRARRSNQFPGSWRARRTGFQTASGTFYVSQTDEKPPEQFSPESIDAKVRELGLEPGAKKDSTDSSLLASAEVETPKGLPLVSHSDGHKPSKA